jgi:hypothetical protein
MISIGVLAARFAFRAACTCPVRCTDRMWPDTKAAGRIRQSVKCMVFRVS